MSEASVLTSHSKKHIHALSAHNAALVIVKTKQRQKVNRLALYCAPCTIEGNIETALNRDRESFESWKLAAGGS
jgi:hypothetical protein